MLRGVDRARPNTEDEISSTFGSVMAALADGDGTRVVRGNDSGDIGIPADSLLHLAALRWILKSPHGQSNDILISTPAP